MDTSQATLSAYNVIVVFRELRLNEVLLTQVRRLLPALPNPMVTEIPNQLIGVVYPDHSIQCQYGNRRVEVRHTPRSGLVGEEPFCDVALAAVEKAKQAGSSEVVAYGLNFDVLTELRDYDRPGQYVVTKFVADSNLLAGLFSGSIEDGAIRVSIRQSNCQVNFDLEGVPPENPSLLKCHVNYHFAEQQPPSDANSLCGLLQDKYEDFFRVLNALPD